MKYCLILFLFFLNLSCAKKLEKSASIENGVPGSINDQYSGENKVSVKVDREELENFWGQMLNDPSDILINLDIKQIEDKNQFKGDLEIAFRDSGSTYNANFATGTSHTDTSYNSWHSLGPKRFFHMMFEDAPCVNENESAYDSQSSNCVGGIVLVIDEVIDLGDGDGPLNQVGGSLWYKNFSPTKAAHPPKRCWLLSLGPYDCRAWVGVDHTQTIEPTSGYEKFVEFFGFRISELFGEDFNLASIFDSTSQSKSRTPSSILDEKVDCSACYLYFILGIFLLSLIIGFIILKKHLKKGPSK